MDIATTLSGSCVSGDAAHIARYNVGYGSPPVQTVKKKSQPPPIGKVRTTMQTTLIKERGALYAVPEHPLKIGSIAAVDERAVVPPACIKEDPVGLDVTEHVKTLYERMTNATTPDAKLGAFNDCVHMLMCGLHSPVPPSDVRDQVTKMLMQTPVRVSIYGTPMHVDESTATKYNLPRWGADPGVKAQLDAWRKRRSYVTLPDVQEMLRGLLTVLSQKTRPEGRFVLLLKGVEPTNLRTNVYAPPVREKISWHHRDVAASWIRHHVGIRDTDEGIGLGLYSHRSIVDGTRATTHVHARAHARANGCYAYNY